MLNLKDAELARVEFTKHHPSGKDDSRVPEYYQQIVQQFNLGSSRKTKKIGFIVVAHFVHSLPYFLEAVASLGDIVALISKQSGVVKTVKESITSIYQEIIAHDVNKINLAESADVAESLFTRLFAHEHLQDHQFVILDHGGYFATQLHSVISKFSSKILGIVEHTWNGEVRYLQQLTQGKFPVPICSIAHSKLKGLEVRDVASSIVDAITTSIGGVGLNQSIRSLSSILILGYGHIGEEVAKVLKRRFNSLEKKKIYICDLSEEAIARARTQFAADHCTTQKADFLSQADLIITATSSKVLTKADFITLKPGAIVACATSSDDQFSSDALEDYEIVTPSDTKASQPCVQYRYKASPAKIFYLLANGDSINFTLGSTSHPILHSIFSSILVNAKRLISQDTQFSLDKIHQSDKAEDIQIRVEYEKFFGEIVDDPIAKLSEEGWSLPANNLTKFVGRVEKLKQIHEQLSHVSAVALTQKHALTGMGGVGKTELAIRYIHQFRSQYTMILWFNAENHLDEQFLKLAEKLQIRTKTSHRRNSSFVSSQTQPYEIESQRPLIEIIKAIYKKLGTVSGTCLIVFDNADNSEKLRSFLPPNESKYQSPGVKILATSRERSAEWSHEIDVGMFTLQEAREYITRHLPQTPEAHCDKLAKKLGFLPLAITKAVSYIKQTRTVNSVEKYLQKFKIQRSLLLRNKTLDTNEQNNRASVLTTWNLSLESIKAVSPAAIKIVSFCAYLDPSDIPISLFNDLAAEMREDPDESISILDQFSLIELSQKTETFGIHRLLQEVIQINQCDAENIFKWIQLLERIKLQSEALLIREICEYLAAHFKLDLDDEKSIANCTRLITHVQKLLKHCKAYEIHTAATCELYKHLGKYYLYIRRDGKTGEKYLLEAVAQLSADKAQSAEVYSLLGFSMLLLGKLHEALQYCERSLAEDTGVEPDANRADRCWVMGHITFNIGDYDKALEFFASAQVILDDLDPEQKRHGRRRVTVSHSLGDLFATQYFRKFDLSVAKLHYRQAHTTYTRFFKVPSFEQFILLTSLARLYLTKERFWEAEKYLNEAETMAVILFGAAEHEENIKLLLLKGNLFAKQQDLPKATAFYDKARQLSKQLEHNPLEVDALMRLTEISPELETKRTLLKQSVKILSPHGNTEILTILKLYLFLLDLQEGKISAAETEEYLETLTFDHFLPSFLIFAAELIFKISEVWFSRGNISAALKIFSSAYTVLKRVLDISILTAPSRATSLWFTEEKCYSFTTPHCNQAIGRLTRDPVLRTEAPVSEVLFSNARTLLNQLSLNRRWDQEIRILEHCTLPVRTYFAEEPERMQLFFCVQGSKGNGKSSRMVDLFSYVTMICEFRTLISQLSSDSVLACDAEGFLYFLVDPTVHLRRLSQLSMMSDCRNDPIIQVSQASAGGRVKVRLNKFLTEALPDLSGILTHLTTTHQKPEKSLAYTPQNLNTISLILALEFALIDQLHARFDGPLSLTLQFLIRTFETSSTALADRESLHHTYRNIWEALQKIMTMLTFDQDRTMTIVFNRFKILIRSDAEHQSICLQTRIAKSLPEKKDFYSGLAQTLLYASTLATQTCGGIVELGFEANALDMRWAFPMSKGDDKHLFKLLFAFFSMAETLRSHCKSYAKTFRLSQHAFSFTNSSLTFFEPSRERSLPLTIPPDVHQASLQKKGRK